MDRVDPSTTMDFYSIDTPLRAQLIEGRNVQETGKPFDVITAHHHSMVVMEISVVEAAR